MNAYAKCRFHSGQTNSHPAMIHAMQGTGSIYFATLQGYVIFETELYFQVVMHTPYTKNWLSVVAMHTPYTFKWLSVVSMHIPYTHK